MSDRAEAWQLRASLEIHGFDGPPEAINLLLGASPTNAWLKGEPTAHSADVPHRESGWILESPVSGEVTADEAIKGLVGTLPDPARVREVAARAYVEVAIVIYATRQQPGCSISAENVRVLADMGANLDIDAYYVGASNE